MNVNTGELFRTDSEIGRRFAQAMAEHDGEIKAVPKEFSEEAERLLGEEERVFADMTADTPLVNWAKSQRNQPNPDGNRKHRRKMAKESRKRNRG